MFVYPALGALSISKSLKCSLEPWVPAGCLLAAILNVSWNVPGCLMAAPLDVSLGCPLGVLPTCIP